jgi:hypothetical protein
MNVTPSLPATVSPNLNSPPPPVVTASDTHLEQRLEVPGDEARVLHAWRKTPHSRQNLRVVIIINLSRERLQDIGLYAS